MWLVPCFAWRFWVQNVQFSVGYLFIYIKRNWIKIKNICGDFKAYYEHLSYWLFLNVLCETKCNSPHRKNRSKIPAYKWCQVAVFQLFCRQNATLNSFFVFRTTEQTANPEFKVNLCLPLCVSESCLPAGGVNRINFMVLLCKTILG